MTIYPKLGKTASIWVFILFLRFIYFVSMRPTCMSVHHVNTWYLWKSEEVIGSLRAGIMDGFSWCMGAWNRT